MIGVLILVCCCFVDMWRRVGVWDATVIKSATVDPFRKYWYLS